MDQFGVITVDQSSKVSGVVARVRAMVHDGTLREGDPLPSTRALAAELGVARGTVVAAYEQLDGEGYLRTRHGAVARVAADVHGRTPGGSVAGGAGPGSPVAFAADAALADPSPAVRIDCRPGIPAVTAIPQRDWRAAWRAAASAPLRNAIAGAARLPPSCRAQVVAQLGLTRRFTTTVDRVLVTAGTSEALSLITEALRSLLGRPPVFGVEDPGYRTGHRAITSAGGTLVAVPVGEDGLDLDALEAAGPVDAAVLVSPTHQYPLGSVMPVARRRRLLAWAAATGTVVVEDDYDSEFRHRGTPVPALAALDAEGVVLHVGGFSKTLDPRLRCAWSRPALRSRCRDRCTGGGGGAVGAACTRRGGRRAGAGGTGPPAAHGCAAAAPGSGAPRLRASPSPDRGPARRRHRTGGPCPERRTARGGHVVGSDHRGRRRRAVGGRRGTSGDARGSTGSRPAATGGHRVRLQRRDAAGTRPGARRAGGVRRARLTGRPPARTHGHAGSAGLGDAVLPGVHEVGERRFADVAGQCVPAACGLADLSVGGDAQGSTPSADS
ncbi:PLP-dependent aminotransferase family protein [Curtobacterium flaccumfaciens]|nr:PLP-dependent aminotransferase family protein [Curtobacterium flaccumfaciens]